MDGHKKKFKKKSVQTMLKTQKNLTILHAPKQFKT